MCLLTPPSYQFLESLSPKGIKKKSQEIWAEKKPDRLIKSNFDFIERAKNTTGGKEIYQTTAGIYF